jgi:hypothetical protein
VSGGEVGDYFQYTLGLIRQAGVREGFSTTTRYDDDDDDDDDD